jgi:hypothetical protein
MDMNPLVSGPDAAFVYKDGIAFSGHKFIGGPGITQEHLANLTPLEWHVNCDVGIETRELWTFEHIVNVQI